MADLDTLVEKCAPAPLAAQLEEVQAALGVLFPTAYVAFLARCNGAIIGPNHFAVGQNQSDCLQGFHELSEVPYQHGLAREQAGDDTVPIAYTNVGNAICIGVGPTNAGAIYFLDHEIPAPDALTRIAPSLDAFIEAIVPGYPEVPPVTGVVHVWVDPSFLEELRRREEEENAARDRPR